MPNWCNNELYIRGDSKDIEAFLNACKGYAPAYKLSEAEKKFFKEVDGDYQVAEQHEFTFNALVPVPQEILEAGYSQAGKSTINAILGTENPQDGYTWQIKNWGTKWDVNDPAIMFSGNDEASLIFSTAWSPPIRWLENVAAQFPDLEFELFFEEMGSVFGGNFVWSDGELQFHEEVQGWEDLKEFCLRNGMYDLDFFEEMEEQEEEE